MTWLNGPLAGFDTETTGVHVETDRIVTACVGYARQPGDWNPKAWLINPGVPIPAEAAAIHGITDEQAATGANPVEGISRISLALRTAWAAGAPLIGHNVIYDLTILDREMRRHLGTSLDIGGPVIDTLVMDKAIDPYRKGSRKLVDTCAHYGIRLDNAHSADDDCFAAVRLGWTMLSRSEYAEWPLPDLHDAQALWFAQQRASFHDYLRRKGEEPDDLNTTWPLAPYEADRRAA